MKKLMIAAAIVCAAAVSQAAAVGWSAATQNADYSGNYYQLFIFDTATATPEYGYSDYVDAVVTDLKTGKTVSSFAENNANSQGALSVTYGNSGMTLDPGSYKAFFVLFDGEAPVKGESKFVVISETNAGLAKTITAQTPNASFAAGNVSSVVGTAGNWQNFGAAPEPTSGLLLLLGVAGLALKRRRA